MSCGSLRMKQLEELENLILLFGLSGADPVIVGTYIKNLEKKSKRRLKNKKKNKLICVSSEQCDSIKVADEFIKLEWRSKEIIKELIHQVWDQKAFRDLLTQRIQKYVAEMNKERERVDVNTLNLKLRQKGSISKCFKHIIPYFSCNCVYNYSLMHISVTDEN